MRGNLVFDSRLSQQFWGVVGDGRRGEEGGGNCQFFEQFEGALPPATSLRELFSVIQVRPIGVG